jgi:aminoglycoside phosphotransferase (APT) family kinase protein
MEPREYSKRLGVISPEQLQAALDQFYLGRLISAESAPGGLFGQNIFLETTSGDYVFRGHPHGDWHLPTEQFFVNLVHKSTGAPVPWPYFVGDSRGLFDWPTSNFAIMPRLPGTSGEASFGSHHRAARNPAFSRSAGEALGRLHQVRLPGPGLFEVNTTALVPLSKSWANETAGRVQEEVMRSRTASRETTDADVEWADAVMEPALPALAETFEATVIHLDYAPGNVVGEGDESAWSVTGVVDWMTAEAGDAEADLCRMVALFVDSHEAARGFLDAYHSIQPERPGWAERFPAYMLLDRLHLWEYGQRTGGWFKPGVSMRDWIEPYLIPPR